MTIDNAIFIKSIQIIKSELGVTGLAPLQQEVLERLIHASGDYSIRSSLKFSSKACEIGISALKAGAPILTDTSMAMAAVLPMAERTLASEVNCVLDWAPKIAEPGKTRVSIGMEKAWKELTRKFIKEKSPIVVIGSAPTGLEVLLDLILNGFPSPSLIIGMPVGFVGVTQSKLKLSNSNCPQIRLDGNRGGAALAGAAINALLRSSFYN
tara:strand:+ start:13362 stop:13991 length:630 start_codon:yes stop_codon:yes gene_type:complete